MPKKGREGYDLVYAEVERGKREREERNRECEAANKNK